MDPGMTVSPELESIHTISVNGIVSDGKLSLSFSYNRFQYERNTIEALMESYKSNLLDIIHHCIQKEQRELTPSDLAEGEEISLEEFENIKEVLNL